MDSYQYESMAVNVQAALNSMRQILDQEKLPNLASDVPHSYQDKYLLVETMVNVFLASNLNNLTHCGLTRNILQAAKQRFDNERVAVTLRYQLSRKSTFLREHKYDQDSAVKHQVSSPLFGSITSKTVTTITDYYWDFCINHEIFLYFGSNPNDKISLIQRTASKELKTSAKQPPHEDRICDPNDVNLNWLLKTLDKNLIPKFQIDRTDPKCRTPRRNAQANDALSFAEQLRYFSSAVFNSLMWIFTNDQNGLDSGIINRDLLFHPMLPLFTKHKENVLLLDEGKEREELTTVNQATEAPDVSSNLPLSIVNALLAQEVKLIDETFGGIRQVYGNAKGLFSLVEAQVTFTLNHLSLGVSYISDGINFVEIMLRRQLIAAIGKEVQPQDFAQYMTFHNRKLMSKEFQPKQFNFAVRRPFHFPEGTISVEAQLPGSSLPELISTNVRHIKSNTPMQFPINAGTNVSFHGDRYLHTWVLHQFSGQAPFSSFLHARARHFSSFILLVGNVISSKSFKP
jgi:hypothetical protein